MTWSSVKQNLLEQQQRINKLDAMMCARLKRTVKVEAEMRAFAAELEKATPANIDTVLDGLAGRIRKWAVKLGCPDEVRPPFPAGGGGKFFIPYGTKIDNGPLYE